ncbi:MAG: class I SAM-dependent methyltransferase [Actinomycetota bacterium]|nr:class I SAM-dependent methyltransferase [Actinomycetota bacterium]
MTKNHQESFYAANVDYRVGSPHLSHWGLYDRLTEVLRRSLDSVRSKNLPTTALEIGAGHGGYTEPVLAAGFDVTAVEMSRPSLARLDAKYGANPRFHSVFHDGGPLPDNVQQYSVILAVSVLHHIPDYLAFLDELVPHLAPDGLLLTLQDPLWYARLRRSTHLLDKGGFYAWRLGQGNLGRGLATVSRRVRGVYDESNTSDMVEYHVVREGVDENAIVDALAPRFHSVEVLRYWSNQSRIVQELGERLGCANAFGISAEGYRPLG